MWDLRKRTVCNYKSRSCFSTAFLNFNSLLTNCLILFQEYYLQKVWELKKAVGQHDNPGFCDLFLHLLITMWLLTKYGSKFFIFFQWIDPTGNSPTFLWYNSDPICQNLFFHFLIYFRDHFCHNSLIIWTYLHQNACYSLINWVN